jgi:hypothetical protein
MLDKRFGESSETHDRNEGQNRPETRPELRKFEVI